MSAAKKLPWLAGLVVTATGLGILGQRAAGLLATDGGPAPPLAKTAGPLPQARASVSPADLGRALEIVLAQPAVKKLGAKPTVTGAHPWLDEEGEPFGVVLDLRLARPLSGRFAFPVAQYREDRGGGAPYRQYTIRMAVQGMERLTAAVDLKRGRLVELQPADEAVVQASGTGDTPKAKDRAKEREGNPREREKTRAKSERRRAED